MLQSYDSFYEGPRSSFHQRGRLLALQGALRHWLSALPKPVGVFAAHELRAWQVVEACRSSGLRVPDDVAVIGTDNDELLCELARPSLSSVPIPAERIGFEAAALLSKLMRGAKPPRRPKLFAPTRVNARQSSDVLAGADPEVTVAARFIRNHAHQPLSVDDVLRHVSISRRALEQRFRRVLDRGIGQEIRRVHLERAKELLATTLLSMADVAEQAGFSSMHYLSRVFRHDVGLTPSDFRRQAQAAVIGSAAQIQ
ncbi:MAG: substrate-binding domain-containing protein [Planctomycetaceae bacterium]|nr:substrate-binding domain-containing protein [Planctomycetaceae bacterium]